jgi:hypothetical protein
MKFTLITRACLGLILVSALAAAPPPLPNPDFTKGKAIPEGATKDWNLGATGARGWMHSDRLETTQARQVRITKVTAGSPADGVLAVGDVLLGVAGAAFSRDPRVEIGRALTAAEAVDGKLALTRWRAGKTEEVTLQLPVLGSYSPTAPYDCPKSARILDRGCEALAKRMAEPGYGQNAITRSLNGLGLLASGDPKYHPLIKKEAEWAADQHIEHMATWWYGYLTVFLAEYVMATGDESVLPGLRRIAMEAAKGQSAVGSWGHKFANARGRLSGYGMMNSPGAPLTIGMVLAREAGVDDPEVATAIERSNTLLRFYIGKGSVPYGDHAPYMAGHEDNGKNGMVTVLFDQLGDAEGTAFFSKMSTAAHNAERDCGHTGNFFNLTWAMPGVSRGGPHATGAWMAEFGGWYFDLARCWDGSFAHQGPPQSRNDSYAGWDATGMYLIAYGMPRKALRLTGKEPSPTPPLDAETARQVVLAGRGYSPAGRPTAYDELSPDVLIEQLGGWSPIVRDRAGAALARRKDLAVEPLLPLLDSPSLDARLGACQALARLGNRAAPAVPKLLEALNSKDLWLRVQATEALNAIGEPAMTAVPSLLRIIARGPTAEDPRGMEQRFVAQTLFHGRTGMLRGSLEGVDQELLLEAVRAGLRNEDGRTRGAFGTVYANLPFDQLRPLLPAIHRAIVEPSPSGIMFDGQIQSAGLDLFSKNHVSEGIELLADYIRLMKPHGSQVQVPRHLDMLKRYGAHAQRAIPRLEQAIHYFENEEKDFPRDLSLKKAEAVREAIRGIREATDKPELVELGL